MGIIPCSPFEEADTEFKSSESATAQNMEDTLVEHRNMLKKARQNMHPFAYKILTFWFPSTFDECMELWFGKSTKIDAEIKNEFGHMIDKAVDENQYNSWIHSSPFECLALIILLDQFTRNIYRNDSKMYRADSQCQAILSVAMWKGYHLELLPVHSVSFCLVLTHSENLILQELCIRVWAQIRDYMSDKHDLVLFDAIFQKHYEVIEKFGRFPHRNEILNRQTTNEEEEFLSNKEFRFDLPLKPTAQGFGFQRTKTFQERFDDIKDDDTDKIDKQDLQTRISSRFFLNAKESVNQFDL